MLTPFRDILRDAYLHHYGVGAFNCLSLEHALGAIEAAEELRSPVILQIAEVQFPYSPLEIMGPMFLELARKASVPVAVHLDHGQSVETCVRAMKVGFNSVMFDGANLPFDVNVKETSAVARMAKAVDVDVEAELGKVGNTSFGTDAKEEKFPDVFTDVEESARFIELTGVDALAVAIGNLHGRYIATPKLNIERLKEISARNNMPLVLHGGSGTSDEDFKACVHNGISKVNVATALQMAVTAKVKDYVADPLSHDYITMKHVMKDATKESVIRHMLLFESDGKA